MARIKDSAERCLHELFEEQARRTPEAVALEDKDTSLTYGELDGLAEELAAYLRSKNVALDEPVDLTRAWVPEPTPPVARQRMRLSAAVAASATTAPIE